MIEPQGDPELNLENTAAGGELLYRSFDRYWHPVAYSADLDSAPLGVRLLGRQIVLARLNGVPKAFFDLCWHRGAPLSLGTVEGDVLRCGYHGWAYDERGTCIEIPAVHGLHPPKRAQLREYRCAEAAGMIFVSLVDDPVFPLPECPYLDDPDFRVVKVPAYDWDCSAPRRMENLMDFAHFAFVHDGLLGYRDQPEVPDHTLDRLENELRIEIDMAEPTETQKNRPTDIEGESTVTTKRYRLFMPFTAMNQQSFANGDMYVLFWGLTPSDMGTTRTHTLLFRNFGKDEATDREILDFNRSIIDADRPIVEAQRPEALPFDITAELHVRSADKMSISYRRWLYELAGARDSS